jgi:hypothetical protein
MKLVFLLEEFAVPSPGQQLLDRFLIGYPRDGEFHRVQDCEIVLCVLGSAIVGSVSAPGASLEIKDALQARVRDFGLSLKTMESSASADAILVAWKGTGAIANEPLLRKTLQTVRAGARCFVHGTLANSGNAAQEMISLAATRHVELCAGTSMAVPFRLPEIEPHEGASISRALIVVQGAFPQAELDGLEGLLTFLESRSGGEIAIRTIEFVQGNEIWTTAPLRPWAKPLLAAAISRSNTIQGDPVKDGRPQDVVGLGLVQKLATHPRGWVLTHADGVQSGILVLEGALEDYNIAIEMKDKTMFSTQLYRPPRPMQEQFSRLAIEVEDFLVKGKSPWPIARTKLISDIMGRFQGQFERSGKAF